MSPQPITRAYIYNMRRTFENRRLPTQYSRSQPFVYQWLKFILNVLFSIRIESTLDLSTPNPTSPDREATFWCAPGDRDDHGWHHGQLWRVKGSKGWALSIWRMVRTTAVGLPRLSRGRLRGCRAGDDDLYDQVQVDPVAAVIVIIAGEDPKDDLPWAPHRWDGDPVRVRDVVDRPVDEVHCEWAEWFRNQASRIESTVDMGCIPI